MCACSRTARLSMTLRLTPDSNRSGGPAQSGMRIRALVLALMLAASLYGQRRRFNWQDYCFEHSAAPFCQGRDYAIKRQPPVKGTDSPVAVTNPFPPAPRKLTSSLVVVSGINWRFADPTPEIG